ncbi:hypothetical protein [Celeribacter neptunius]|uniref:Uncharacterized protein n=1 Tax=Celeribacter neptunius TaxID=588602 RepID=A0A1I3QWA7_9RHOB|nr:hypothetical protein [Celeribacter neptunius]SFJ38165.1 hypothetical protein SAMN04487991_1983 [Celeribacter neptunius]
MDILTTLRTMFDQWVAGLDASDQVTLMAIGLGLMIFSVAALLVIRHRESNQAARFEKRLAPEVSDAPTFVPGERHVVARQKGDAFLRRLEQMG